MKKNPILLFLISIFLVTGCQMKNGLSTEKSVYNYLHKNYPGDSFVVQLYNDVTIRSTAGGCDSVPGHTWIVTSKNTGISFYVQDYYSFNSFTCEYSLTDDYFDVYFSNKIKEIGDSRVFLDANVHKSDINEEGYGFLSSVYGVNLNLNSFASEHELAEVAVAICQALLEDEHLRNELPTYFWFNIYDGDTIICSIDFRTADNVNYIIEKISEKK